METIFTNHFKCLRKYVTSLNRQRDTLKCHFLEYHKMGKKFQEVFQENWSTISSYLHMFEALQLTQIYQSRLLEIFGLHNLKADTLSKNEKNKEMILEENTQVIPMEQEKPKNFLYQETSNGENDEIKFQENTQGIFMEQDKQNNVLNKETPKAENYAIKSPKPEEKIFDNIIETKEDKTHKSKVQGLEKNQNELQVMENNKQELSKQNNKIKHSKSKEDKIKQHAHGLEKNENELELMEKTKVEISQQNNKKTHSKMIFKDEINNCRENESKQVLKQKECQKIEKSQIILTKYEEKQLETCKQGKF